jgi:zinc transport system substrate-binding protein
MKFFKKAGIAAILLSLLTLAGCGGVQNSADTDNGKLKVYTSFYAIYDFVNKIGGDKIELTNVVPTGTEPHDWEPAIKDMASFENCDILFYNGAGMESWIEKVQSSVSNNLEYVELSDGIADENAADPHIWLSPANAKLMAERIAEVLSQADAENAAYYGNNLSDFEQKLDELDKNYKTVTTSFKNKDIVVSHEAYSYLCAEYGLNQVSIDGISADSEPSPEKMKQLVNYINDNNIKYIFYEELLSPKTAQTLATETGAQLLPLNPFEGLTDDEIAAGEDYISVMEENLNNINTALGE